ncbi:MAG: TraM recognition domain-containing protein [Planctomycetota bacterium]
MPRSVYRQSSGNPIQHKLVPSEPLELEFAYHRGVDNDDTEFTTKVLKELVLASFVALLCCWVQLFVFDVTLFVMLLAGLFMFVAWRRVKSHLVAIRDVSIAIIGVAWVYHLFPVPVAIEVYVALTATALVAREVVRHFTFVATVSPTSVDAAWNTREAICWQTLASSLLLVPIALCVLIPQYTPILLMITAVGCLIMAATFGTSLERFAAGFQSAVNSWCSYNRDDEPIAGVLVSPSGDCRRRLTMLVVAVLLNVFAFFRVTNLFQVSEVSVSFGNVLNSGSLLELFFSIGLLLLLCAVLAVIPVLLVFLAIGIVGTPVLGRLSIPKPSFVPASEWKEITDRIRSSQNEIERDSLYLGRVTFDQSPMLVPSEVFREHAHFLGDSGSGKTARGLSPFIEQVIGGGNASVMVLDLKGDSPELLQTLKQGAKTAKALNGIDVPVRYFTQRDDLATYGFNPFKLPCWNRLNELQKTDILCGALGLNYGSDYGEGYFSSANASVLYATVSHFPDINNFEQLRDKLAYVISSPKRHGLDDKSKDAGNHVKMSVTRLASIAALNITDDCTPNQAVADFCIDPTRLFLHPEAHYFSLSATLGPGSSPEIGRLASYMLLTAATLTERKVPVYLVVDEFQRMASRNLDYLLQLARSMGVAVILANQSMQDLVRYDLTSTLETNCRYRQWFAISGWDDQERLSRASGETVDTMDSISVSQSVSDRGTTTSTSRSRNDFIAPRLTKNDIKLVSDDDRKSVVLINRGAGYAQYGGMPVIIESDFHISAAEYGQRKAAPWPSTDIGTFLASDWERPKPEVPHRGRKPNTSPSISKETITVGPEPEPQPKPTPSPKKQRRRKSKGRAKQHSATSTKPVPSASVGVFDRYLQDHPLDPSGPTTAEGK